ncbi:MAG: hypothetical protein FD153_1877 [Rhodospirillaceae bacterium]|nr:MAG: hypothetical protein FD153_1877 [Rhodospirillaceae bacterium]
MGDGVSGPWRTTDDPGRPTIREFLDALSEDTSGQACYSNQDQVLIDAWTYHDDMIDLVDQYDIDPRGVCSVQGKGSTGRPLLLISITPIMGIAEHPASISCSCVHYKYRLSCFRPAPLSYISPKNISRPMPKAAGGEQMKEDIPPSGGEKVLKTGPSRPREAERAEGRGHSLPDACGQK